MSGGSFNYLHCWENDERRGDLEEVARILREEFQEKELADATEAFTARPSESLRRVWKAVEWMKSSDWSYEDVLEVIAEVKSEPTTTAPTSFHYRVDSRNPEHTRVSVFAGKLGQGSRGKCGDLTFRNEEWEALVAMAKAVEGGSVDLPIDQLEAASPNWLTVVRLQPPGF